MYALFIVFIFFLSKRKVVFFADKLWIFTLVEQLDLFRTRFCGLADVSPLIQCETTVRLEEGLHVTDRLVLLQSASPCTRPSRAPLMERCRTTGTLTSDSLSSSSASSSSFLCPSQKKLASRNTPGSRHLFDAPGRSVVSTWWNSSTRQTSLAREEFHFLLRCNKSIFIARIFQVCKISNSI